MSRIFNIAVLYGGPSSEHEVSLNTGKNIIQSINKSKYSVFPVFISKDGGWFVKNQKVPAYVALRDVDAVFNAMHGEFGEDGAIQSFLDTLGIAYTGSDKKASMIGMDKALTKHLCEKSGIKTARCVIAEKRKSLPKMPFSYPIVVKPNSGGSSVGVQIVNNDSQLKKALQNAFKFDKRVIIEKFVKGKEITIGILQNFKGRKFFALPITEIIPEEKYDFFDYDAKYRPGAAKEITPAEISPSLALKAQRIAIDAFRTIGARHYSRIDFIIDKNEDVYLLEINTLPGMTSTSLLPQQAKKAGLNLEKLTHHLIQLALNEEEL